MFEGGRLEFSAHTLAPIASDPVPALSPSPTNVPGLTLDPAPNHVPASSPALVPVPASDLALSPAHVPTPSRTPGSAPALPPVMNPETSNTRFIIMIQILLR